MTKKPKTCPYCGHREVHYKHSLTAGLVQVMRILWDAGGGPIHYSKLDLSYSQASNLQKLRYFGLVAKATHTEKRSGYWLLTTNGVWFLTGKYRTRRNRWTKDGQVLYADGDPVTIHEVDRENKSFVPYEEWKERMEVPDSQLEFELEDA